MQPCSSKLNKDSWWLGWEFFSCIMMQLKHTCIAVQSRWNKVTSVALFLCLFSFADRFISCTTVALVIAIFWLLAAKRIQLKLQENSISISHWQQQLAAASHWQKRAVVSAGSSGQLPVSARPGLDGAGLLGQHF